MYIISLNSYSYLQIVHKQFNSPLGLYSSENVQEAMVLQSGIIAP